MHGHLLPGVSGWYSRIVYLGDEPAKSLDSTSPPKIPVYTFTCPQSFIAEMGPPSPSYARTIGRGIRQTYGHLSVSDIAKYLSSRKGPHGKVSSVEVERWLEQEK